LGSAHEWCETCGELGRPVDHRGVVVAGKLDQRCVERYGAPLWVEVASLFASGDDDPLRDRDDALEGEPVASDRGDVTVDEELDVVLADLRPVAGAGQ
jgi:hypothetical protein